MDYLIQKPEISALTDRRQYMVSLWKDNLNVLSMVFDELLQTARFESNGIKRLFMLYREGKRHRKTVFKNEYGFDIGNIEENVDQNGFGKIDVLGNKYYYHLPAHDVDALSVYSDTDVQPLAKIVTNIPANEITPSQTKLSADYLYGLLIGICWYLQLSFTKK